MLSKDKHSLFLPQTKTARWKKTSIQCWPLLYLDVAGFQYNAWTLSKVLHLHVFRADRQQHLVILKDLSLFRTVSLILNPWNDHSGRWTPSLIITNQTYLPINWCLGDYHLLVVLMHHVLLFNRRWDKVLTNPFDGVWIKAATREWRLPVHCKTSQVLFSTVICCRTSQVSETGKCFGLFTMREK